MIVLGLVRIDMTLDKKEPLVSIAIVTYNQKNYLKECIESCLAQEYQNIEIVVADDGSTDGTYEILEDYAKKNSGKFVLQRSKENQGITKNSNLAHFSCTGKYIAWMGGDDLMLSGKIRRQVEFMEKNPDCTICYHNLDVFDSETNSTLFLFNKKNKYEGDFSTCIRYGAFNGACSNMVRSNKIPVHGFNQSLIVASDWLYWIETLANGGSIKYIDEVLGRYRRHDKNVTYRDVEEISQNDLDHLLTCQLLIEKYPNQFNNIMHSYAKLLSGIRHKLDYRLALKTSFLLRPNFTVLGALLVNLISFRRLKP
jgi:glycosyltransferase involved in cell wall biosynthesis